MTILELSGATRLVMPAEDATLSLPGVMLDPQTTLSTGCRDPKQPATYIVASGSGAGLNWTVRDQHGTPIELATLTADVDLTEPYERVVLFHNPFCAHPVRGGQLSRGPDNQLRIHLPSGVGNFPGIYEMEVHWREGTGPAAVHYLNRAYVSVEQSLASRALGPGASGPLELSRIRNRLRDYVSANDTFGSGAPEYSTEEIVLSILEPVEYYNEALPAVVTFTVNNFPYRQQWTDAVIGRLLLISGQWMMRNNVPIQAEGVGADDRAKYRDLIQIGNKLWSDYQLFVRADKISRNMAGGFRIVN